MRKRIFLVIAIICLLSLIIGCKSVTYTKKYSSDQVVNIASTTYPNPCGGSPDNPTKVQPSVVASYIDTALWEVWIMCPVDPDKEKNPVSNNARFYFYEVDGKFYNNYDYTKKTLQ